MHKLMLLALALALGPREIFDHLPSPRQSPSPEIYVVVVNANNPSKETADAAKKTVKALFLKELSRWSDGVEARPYSREANATEQTVFVKEVLGMTPAELARHWLKLKNMNGSTPPTEVDTDRMLLKHVARHDGAFGVVKKKNAEAAGVRILFEFREPS